MNPIAKGVKDAVRRITDLHQQVQERLRPSPPMVKRVPFFSNTLFTWRVPDMGVQSIPWVNGAEDAYVTAVTYACGVDVGNPGPPPGVSARLTTSTDYGVVSFGNTDARIPAFDFEWNYKLPSSGLTYASPANGAQYADRRSLGNLQRGEPLQFAEPLVVPAGDALVWIVRPTLYTPFSTGLSAGMAVEVAMIVCGYRTGTMAEADYDRR